MPNAMHSFDTNSSNVPAFLVKLWKLVEDPTCDDLIAWSDSGYSFVIKDQARFAKELLPQYFKHNNMASFIRQLNMYGFKKVMNYEKSGLRNENDEMEFQNGFFLKEKYELLELIKRKIPNPRVSDPPVKTNAKDILIDLTSIREKQENMDNMLLKMKKENELLWRELTSMRQKHKAQEQIIQKVIQFLVSIVQRSNPNIGVQRKITRMLHNSSAQKGNTSQVSRTIDVLRKNNSDCIIVPDGIVSPLGPVIHEVTDVDHDDPSHTNSPQADTSSNNQKDAIDIQENKSPDVRSPISPSVPIESLSILEALQPRTSVVGACGSETNESILGIPLEYITVSSNCDGSNVISIPENSAVCNIIPISDSNDKIDVISIPEANNTNISNVISIPEGDSVIGNVISISESDTLNSVISVPESYAVQTPVSEPSKSTVGNNTVDSTPANKSTDNISSSDYFDAAAIEALTDLPSTSFSTENSSNMLAYSDLSKDDFDDQLLSVSLNTPKIPISDEDVCSLTLKNKSKTSKKGVAGQSPSKKVTHNEHNYQLTTNDSTSLVKNALSNHLLSVDEKLNFTQDRLASNPWNMDVQSLLGVCALQNSWTSLDAQLFSTDDVLNYDAFANQLNDEINIKAEPNDIVGNEIVQFTPNMLEVEMDIGDTQLFEALNQENDASNTDQNSTDFYQPESLLQEVLNETAASEAVDFLNSEDLLSNSNTNTIAKRRKEPKTPRGKRRKLK